MATVVCLALRNRNNPAVFDHCCERSQVQEGISAWHCQQKQLIDNSDDSTELERVGSLTVLGISDAVRGGFWVRVK